MTTPTPSPPTDRFEILTAILDRSSSIDSLSALTRALKPQAPYSGPTAELALGLDANVLLRMGTHPQSADIVDYIKLRHSGPIILSGQVVQEFWNNLSVVQSLSTSLKGKFKALQEEISKVDATFGDFSTRLEALLTEFSTSYGHYYDPKTLTSVNGVLETISAKAHLSYVPRARFYQIALQRKATKTPPGFKDDGDGDFFVWLEFLSGLQLAQESGSKFEHVIFLTQDKKPDWSRSGIPHPILAAEVISLTGASFELWTLDNLAEAIGRTSQAAAASIVAANAAATATATPTAATTAAATTAAAPAAPAAAAPAVAAPDAATTSPRTAAETTATTAPAATQPPDTSVAEATTSAATSVTPDRTSGQTDA